MKLQEFHAKALLRAAGLPGPALAAWQTTAAEARAQAEAYLGAGAERVVVKAQVLVGRPGQGRRGQAGRRRPPRRRRSAAAILGMDIKGITVRRVLVAPGGGHRARVLPRGGARPGRPAHPAHGLGRGRRGDRGGRRARDPEAIAARATPIRISACSTTRPASSPSRSASAPTCATPWPSPRASSACLVANDADLVEVNPLAIVRATGRRRRADRDAPVPGRQGHHRRLGAGAPPRAGGHARPRRGGPGRRRRRGPRASASSSSTATSAAWSTAPAWR